MNVQLHFINEGVTVSVPEGTDLLHAQLAAGLDPHAPCSGHGTCGKCDVEIRPLGGTWRRVQGCCTKADTDLEIRTMYTTGQISVLNHAEERDIPWLPWVETVELHVPPCPVGQNTADWSRLILALECATGRKNWQISIPLAARLRSLLEKTQGHLWAIVAHDQILELSDAPRTCYMAAFDLGTTTLAGYLLSKDGVCARAGAVNPQSRYGADVIARIEYATEHGADDLSQCVRAALDDLLGTLCAKAAISRNDVFAVSLVGNTCMHHLFLNIAPQSLARAPYQPTLSDAMILRCSDYGIYPHTNAQLLLLPVIAGFVGSDTVACLVAGNWESEERLTLLVDIGTNGEIVLGNRHRMIACSTAAGPAFEGTGIGCGMRASAGAVDHIWLESGKICYSVIANTQAKGICGSGLIDLIAVLREIGQIDESGKLLSDAPFCLDDSDIVLTQKDIRQFQLAKAAISAGIRLLAQHLGVSLDQIENVCIAGAFGTFMDLDNVCRIGLIPRELRGKLRAVGNAAGEGAKAVMQNRLCWDSARRLAEQTSFLELATIAEFQEMFVDELAFPEELWEK